MSTFEHGSRKHGTGKRETLQAIFTASLGALGAAADLTTATTPRRVDHRTATTSLLALARHLTTLTHASTSLELQNLRQTDNKYLEAIKGHAS